MSKNSNNINVVYIDLPCTINSFTVSNADMSYTIVLNSKKSHQQNLQAYLHEYRHILDGDFEKKCSADMIEIMAHQI